MNFLNEVTTNKMFFGLAMIIMQLGSRYVVTDLSEMQSKLLASKLAKKVIVFCMFFIPTRDLLIAAMLTFAFFFIFDQVLNEKKQYNIIASRNEQFDQGVDPYDIYRNQIILQK